MKDQDKNILYFETSTRISGLILFISCFSLINLDIKNTASAETIQIDNYTDFVHWWTISEGGFEMDNPPSEIPAPTSGGVWFIGEETASKRFSVTFEISSKFCYHTKASIIISYVSFNSVATLFPHENNGDPYYHFKISNGISWYSTGNLEISTNNDNQIITIVGEVLPFGYFAFNQIWIIVEGVTTGCTTSTEESTTSITEEPTTESNSETTETAEEEFTITATTEQISTQTTMQTSEMTTTTPSPSTSTIQEPDPEETLEPTRVTESSTLISSTTIDYTANSSPWTDLTMDSSDSSTSPSNSPSTDATTSDFPTSHQPTTLNTIDTTPQSTSTRVTTSSYQPSSTTTGQTYTSTSERPSQTTIGTTAPETTPSSGNPNDGLSTEDLVLFIILPSVVIMSVLIGGFSFAHVPPRSISKSSTPSSQPPPHPSNNHVLGMTPSSDLVQEIPRVRIS